LKPSDASEMTLVVLLQLDSAPLDLRDQVDEQYSCYCSPELHFRMP
jgi:hypothetical protein